MNYTPGPWTVKGGSIQAISHATYFSIASVKSQKLTDEGNTANARLVAAAPDLLVALERYFSEMEIGDAGQRDIEGFELLARSAIAKATGVRA